MYLLRMQSEIPKHSTLSREDIAQAKPKRGRLFSPAYQPQRTHPPPPPPPHRFSGHGGDKKREIRYDFCLLKPSQKETQKRNFD